MTRPNVLMGNYKITQNYPLAILLVLILIASFITPRFVTRINFLNVVRHMSILAIVSIGTTFVLISGGIDLSVGSVAAFSAATTALTLTNVYSVVIAIFVGLAVGVLGGLTNGLLVARAKITPIMVTFGTMLTFRGIVMVLLVGHFAEVWIHNRSFLFIGDGFILRLPAPVWIMIGLYLLAYFILSWTKLGRYTYSMGSNEEAAVRTGINVANYKMCIYLLAGITAAVGGIVILARAGEAGIATGQGLELQAITAAFIGGISSKGGRGSLIRTLEGVAIISVVTNVLTLLGTSAYHLDLATGLILIGAITLQRRSIGH